MGYVHGGSAVAPCVIPSEVVIGGTTRSFSAETRDLIERRIGELAELAAKLWGCKAEFTFKRVASVLISREEQFKAVAAAAIATIGNENFSDNEPLTCGGEDFANMMKGGRPGAFLWIGNGSRPDGIFHQLHTPRYNFNDDIIPVGVRYWVSLAMEELSGSGSRTMAS